jgi:hypothetical protein
LTATQQKDEMSITHGKVPYGYKDQLSCVSFDLTKEKCGEEKPEQELSFRLINRRDPENFVQILMESGIITYFESENYKIDTFTP